MSKPKCTPADAQAVWISLAEAGTAPTLRLVGDALAASGKFRRVPSTSTIGRWHNANWETKPKPRACGPEKAEADLQAAVPAFTGEPTTRLKDVVEKREPADPNVDFVERAPQEVAKLLIETAPDLIKDNIDGLARLLTAVTGGGLHVARRDREHAEADHVSRAPPKDMGGVVIENVEEIDRLFAEAVNGGA